jgi:hypothetical protein
MLACGGRHLHVDLEQVPHAVLLEQTVARRVDADVLEPA